MKFQRWSKQRLEKICYSDESHIFFRQNGLQYVRKYDDEDWNYEQLRKIAQVDRLAINIWMMISYGWAVRKDQMDLFKDMDKWRILQE
jgi:hypothetical protein